MTITHRATVDVFLQAFHSLSKSQRDAFLEQLFQEKAYREDLIDLATIEARRREPSRPLRQYLAQRASRRASKTP